MDDFPILVTLTPEGKEPLHYVYVGLTRAGKFASHMDAQEFARQFCAERGVIAYVGIPTIH